MIKPTTYSCNQKGCGFKETGECLEGLNLEDCTHLSPLRQALSSGEVEVDIVETSSQKQTKIQNPVYSSRAFSPAEANAFAAENNTTLIVLAGDVDSGKTTLIGRSFVQFMLGDNKSWHFAGSKTLLAFDERIHNHRVASNLLRANTPHTPRDQEEYFHLDLQSTDKKRFISMLFHDISGENYQDAINSNEDADTMHFISRADTICLLLNGQQLLDQVQKYYATGRMRDILQAIIDVGHLKPKTPIMIIVTKWDFVEGHDKQIDVDDWIESTIARIQKIVDDSGIQTKVQIHRVASISHNSQVKAGHGFEEIFNNWVESRDRRHNPPPIVKPNISPSHEGWTALGYSSSGNSQISGVESDE